MTHDGGTQIPLTCPTCEGPLPRPGTRKTPKVYCSTTCQKTMHKRRFRARKNGLHVPEGEHIPPRGTFPHRPPKGVVPPCAPFRWPAREPMKKKEPTTPKVQHPPVRLTGEEREALRRLIDGRRREVVERTKWLRQS